MSTRILGISAYYHDSAIALLEDGEIVFAAQEERFTRKKHDAAFPKESLKQCLTKQKLKISDLDYIVFYDKPLLKFERLLETYLVNAPKGLRSFLAALPVWLKEKLFIKSTLKKELAEIGGLNTKDIKQIYFSDHHHSHAASAYFSSPYDEAIILCLDGVGEWATSSAWVGKNNTLKQKWEIQFPHSLGLLYSAFTYYIGFKVNSGEYKLMGLAPYGKPTYVDTILNNLIDIKPDGSFQLNMKYFNFATGLTMVNKRFEALFGGPAKKAESTPTQREMDIAASIQAVTEKIVLTIAKNLKQHYDIPNLCLAGGVALNCVANGKLLKESGFENIWIQPAAGDAGGSLGAAQAL